MNNILRSPISLLEAKIKKHSQILTITIAQEMNNKDPFLQIRKSCIFQEFRLFIGFSYTGRNS